MSSKESLSKRAPTNFRSRTRPFFGLPISVLAFPLTTVCIFAQHSSCFQFHTTDQKLRKQKYHIAAEQQSSSSSSRAAATTTTTNMLQLQANQIEQVVERQSRRLQLTESLQDYFALNPKTYKRHTGAELPDEWFVPDDTETSQSTTATSLSLDSTQHTIRKRSPRSNNNNSLDVTVHCERKISDTPTSITTATKETHHQEPPKTGRRVRWLMDFDPSDGSIE